MSGWLAYCGLKIEIPRRSELLRDGLAGCSLQLISVASNGKGIGLREIEFLIMIKKDPRTFLLVRNFASAQTEVRRCGVNEIPQTNPQRSGAMRNY